MNIALPIHPSADPAPSSQGSVDPAADPIAWSLRMLEGMVETGLEMLQSRLRQELLFEQALRCQVEAGQVVARPAGPEPAADDEAPDQDIPEPKGKQPRGEVGLTYQRLSLGIRLCLALHAQIREGRAALGEKAAAEQTRRATLERNEQKRLKKARVKRAIGLAIDAEGKRGTREFMLRPLRERLDERLRDEDLDADLLRLPISEILKRICFYLGLDPNWDLWKHEAWAVAEAEAAVPGSPYTAPSNAAEAPPGTTTDPAPPVAPSRPPRAETASDPP